MNERDIAVIPAASSDFDVLYDRYLGGLLGGAIADALGWITEFNGSWKALESQGITRIDDYLPWTKPTGGRFHTYYDYISQGEYSDDTQLTLCTARSLRADGTFDPERFVEEMKAWLDYARGAGAAITAAGQNLRAKRVRWFENFHGLQGRGQRRGYLDAGGNGAAMRVMPHALANPHDAGATFYGSWQNSVITHGHPRAIVGAVTMAEAVRVLAANEHFESVGQYARHMRAFVTDISVPEGREIADWKLKWEERSGESFDEALSDTKRELDRMLVAATDVRIPYQELLNTLGCFEPATKGSGTACTAAAIGAFLRWHKDYKNGVLEIVNTRGIDTDTIGAMYGCLVGVSIGSTQIPDRWSTQMQDYEYFLAVADALTKIALRDSVRNELVVDADLIEGRERDLVELTEARTITKNQRVMHRLLGPAWVQSVSEQQRRSGGLMLLVDVVMDTGQTMRFHAYRGKPPKGSSGSQPLPMTPKAKSKIAKVSQPSLL